MTASAADFAADVIIDDATAGHSEGGEFTEGADENGNHTAITGLSWDEMP